MDTPLSTLNPSKTEATVAHLASIFATAYLHHLAQNARRRITSAKLDSKSPAEASCSPAINKVESQKEDDP